MKYYLTTHKLDCSCCICKAKKGKHFGENAPNFKNGRTLVKKFCIDCNKPISYHATRCNGCAKRICNLGRVSGFKNKHHTPETKLKISKKLKGKFNGFYGKKHTEKSINKMLNSQGRKEWQKSFPCHKNNKELIIENLLNSLFPNQYKYVGNFKFWIERYNPDFINCNGQKKIIEFFGDYWHNLPNYKIRDKRRLETYKKYGYDTLVIWENELDDLNKLQEKIIVFNS
jgi:very-short-patch-repair endonuclease